MPGDFPRYGKVGKVQAMSNSRIDEIIAGKLAWTEVDLLNINDGSAEPLRKALEEFGIHVNYRPIGQARHLVTALGGDSPVAPHVIVSCHGDDGRILLPELGGPVAEVQPFSGRMGPEHIRARLRIPGSIVICTGCETGNSSLAEAFLDVGATTYFAPSDAPDSHAAFFAVLLLFYELTAGRDFQSAADRVRAYDGELSMWKLWTR
ncbi:hypothetical protein [Nocardia asiatica]|uniref:hypothetical protein n=1 Tax=Nocardia asiatica TaxID=209252 RepID=UPI0002F9424D|nr:hypothetical protein [Nocardia asiatica]